jgi:uncharacterized phage-associated protein
MTDFENRKLTEMVVYILEKTGGIDFYHTFKILYFTELKHLAKWGSRAVPDEFCALQYGPVPSHLYDAVKELENPQTDLAKELAKAVSFAQEDAPNVLLTNRSANTAYLSRSEIEALDESIRENQSLTFKQLKQKSHDPAWAEAHKSGNGKHLISTIDMAKAMNVDDAMLEYIEEQLEIDSVLK